MKIEITEATAHKVMAVGTAVLVAFMLVVVLFGDLGSIYVAF